jgi:hypothetical protein
MALNYNPTAPFDFGNIEIREDENGRTFLAFPDGTRFKGIAHKPAKPSQPTKPGGRSTSIKLLNLATMQQCYNNVVMLLSEIIHNMII